MRWNNETIYEKKSTGFSLYNGSDVIFIMEFSSLVKDSPGNAELHFLVRDEDGQMYVNLMSRTMKISVQKELVNYLKNQPLLDYKIN